MVLLLLLLLCTAQALGQPLAEEARPLGLDARREGGYLVLRCELGEELPKMISSALPSGAQVRVTYQLRVRSPRRLVWDRRVWRGSAVAAVVFDPVIGRYRCELILDEVLVASEEIQSAENALLWLAAPPAFRLALPPTKKDSQLRVRARAVFSSSTTWLVFPSTDGTEWVETAVSTSP